MKTIAKLLVFVSGLAMLSAWVLWQFFPETPLELFGISYKDIFGINTLKSDVGGVFLALGICILISFLRGTKWLKAARLILIAILLARVISIIQDGYTHMALFPLFGEIIAILLFSFVIKKYPTPYDYANEIHPDFRFFRFATFQYKGNAFKRIVNAFMRFQFNNVKLKKDIEENHYSIKGYKDRDLKITTYKLNTVKENAPCIMLFHGGGFWMESRPDYKKFYGKLAKETEALLVYVDYGLSLDHPYPAATEDCYNATLWAFQNADNIGINKNKIALYGDSAGGNLAAVVSQMLRDRNQFQPCLQMMIYPVADNNFKTESAKRFQGVPIWNTPSTIDATKIYMRDFPNEEPAYAFPLKAKDFSNLPPAYIEVAEFDSLKDEGILYAEKLSDADVPVEFHEILGAIHAFELNPRSEITKTALHLRYNAFRRAFE